MNILTSDRSADWLDDIAEPSDAELSAIESEWPAIEAELLRLDVAATLPIPASDTTPVARKTRRRRRRILTATKSMAVAS